MKEYYDSNNNGKSFDVRWSVKKDISKMLDIERKSSDNPWTEDIFHQYLTERTSIMMVAHPENEHNEIIGFMVYELRKGKINLVSLAVDPNLRREGIGSIMIHKLKSKLSENRRKEIIFNIRESNLEGQLFLKNQGFKATGKIYRRDYEETEEDVYHMSYKINENDVIHNRISKYFLRH